MKWKKISGVCDGIQCNGGKCVAKGSAYMCQCNEGWSGLNCDHEYKTSIAGWIAAIVVLSILLLISMGLFCIFMLRFSSTKCLFVLNLFICFYCKTFYIIFCRIETEVQIVKVLIWVTKWSTILITLIEWETLTED